MHKLEISITSSIPAKIKATAIFIGFWMYLLFIMADINNDFKLDLSNLTMAGISAIPILIFMLYAVISNRKFIKSLNEGGVR